MPQTTGSIAPEKRRQQVGHGEQVDVKGFRSATFGMDESRVRASIRQDFKVADKDIKTTDNKSERTKVLSVSVDNVLPGGGRAEVSYVMGYQSKKLIQVGVSWSAASDAKLTADQLLANANLLRSHFMSAGYRPDTLALNLPVSSGLMMFRGSDADGHTTLLMLHGRTVKSAEKQRVLAPTALTLYYVVDPVKPDVYRLPKGLF